MTIDARGWKPYTPWKVTMRRGWGELRFTAHYSATSYAQAKAMAAAMLAQIPPYGVAPWETSEVSEGDVAPKKRKVKSRVLSPHQKRAAEKKRAAQAQKVLGV